jgi:hypothetical protein
MFRNLNEFCTLMISASALDFLVPAQLTLCFPFCEGLEPTHFDTTKIPSEQVHVLTGRNRRLLKCWTIWIREY